MSNQEVITENDYKFIEADDSDWYAIELLAGKWKSVKYMYGQVKVNESPELGTATLSFSWNPIDLGKFEEDDLLNDINFKNYIGGVLQNIIEVSLEENQKNNVASIGIGNNE
tara:strand:+ start:71 stop:406 length:336 start_codon:yes stop_codon:yes gene_type:complete